MRFKPYLLLVSVVLDIAVASCAPQKVHQTDNVNTKTTPSEYTSGMEGMNAHAGEVMGFDYLLLGAD